MKLIVGLGNPGAHYAETRHNAGRRLIEYIARRNSRSISKKKSLEASIASWNCEGEETTLAFPEVFMNQSGTSVLALIRHFGLDAKKHLLIVVDDVALPFGRLRLRSRGSDGGHNGLKSIHESLGHSDYARLRMGIGAGEEEKAAERMEEFVLSPFDSREKKAMPPVLEKGAEACRLWVTQSIASAMNVVNASKK